MCKWHRSWEYQVPNSAVRQLVRTFQKRWLLSIHQGMNDKEVTMWAKEVRLLPDDAVPYKYEKKMFHNWELQMACTAWVPNTRGRVVVMMVEEVRADCRNPIMKAIYACLGVSTLAWRDGKLLRDFMQRNYMINLHFGKKDGDHKTS